jgi:hypothetical protein
MRAWTENEINVIKEKYYKLEMGVKEILPFLPGRSERAVILKAHRLNIKRKGCGRTYSYDFDFWKDYNKLNCYWAGMVAADGSIYQNQRLDSYTFSLGLQEKYQIEKFIHDTKGTYKIYNKRVRDNEVPMYYAKYTATKGWKEELENNFNIKPRKSWGYDAPTQIPEEFFPYFLVGFIDGDGHIGLTARQNPVFFITISLATKEILDYIKEWSDKNYPSSRKMGRTVRRYSPSNRPNEHVYCFTIAGKAACQMYLDLRKLVPERHLARKWDDPDKVKFCQDYLLVHGADKKV